MSLHVLSSKYVKALPKMCLDWDHSLVLKSSERTDFSFCHPADFWICCYCYLAEMVMCTLILHDIYRERERPERDHKSYSLPVFMGFNFVVKL